MTDTQPKRGRPTQGTEAKSKRYGLRLTPTTKQQLEELAKYHKCSKSEFMNLAIGYFYEDMKEAN